MGDSAASHEVVRWWAYPSWNQFAWLYLFVLGATLRGLLGLRYDLWAGAVWLGGAAVLLACAALLRHWARFVVTSRRVLIENGYTGRVIESIDLEHIDKVMITQGPFARFLGIGTMMIRSINGETVISFRGIRDPEAVKARIQALRA